MVGPNITMETASSTPSLVLLERLMDSPAGSTYPKSYLATDKSNSLPSGTIDNSRSNWPHNFLQELIQPPMCRKSEAAYSRRVDRVDCCEGNVCSSSPVISVQSQVGKGHCENCGKVMRDVATNTDLEPNAAGPANMDGALGVTSDRGNRQRELDSDQIRAGVLRARKADSRGSDASDKSSRRRSLPAAFDWWSEKVLRRQSSNLKENVRKSWCPDESVQPSTRGLSVSDQSINCRTETKLKKRVSMSSDSDLQSPRFGVWNKRDDIHQRKRERVNKPYESAPNLSFPSTLVDKSESARLAAWWEESPIPGRSQRFTFQSHTSGKKVVLKKGQKGFEISTKGSKSHSIDFADLEELMAAVSGSEEEETETETEDENRSGASLLVPYKALEEEILVGDAKYSGNINQSNSIRSLSSLTEHPNGVGWESIHKPAMNKTTCLDLPSWKHSSPKAADKLYQSSCHANEPVPSTGDSVYPSPSLESVIQTQFLRNTSFTSLAIQQHNPHHQPGDGFRTPKRLQGAPNSGRGRGRGRGQLRHSWAGNPNPISGSMLKLVKGDRSSWMGVVSEMPVIPEDRGKERDRDADNIFTPGEFDPMLRTVQQKHSEATSALGSQDPRLDPESSFDDLEHIGTTESNDQETSQSEKLVGKGSSTRTNKSLKCKVTPPTSYFNPWVLQPQQLRQKLESLQQEQVVVDQVRRVQTGEYDVVHAQSKRELIVVDIFDDSKEVCCEVDKTMRKMPQDCVTEDSGNSSVSVNNSNMDASCVAEHGLHETAMTDVRRCNSLVDGVVRDVSNLNQSNESLVDSQATFTDASNEMTDKYGRTTNNNRSLLSSQAREYVSKVNRAGAVGKRRSQSLLPDDQLNAYRQRKKSLALAMNEGRLEMKEVAMRPLDIETDFHLIAQLNQLNRELMDLSRSGSSTSPSSPGPNTNQTAFSLAEQSPEIVEGDEDKRTSSSSSLPQSPAPETKRSSYGDARIPISPRKLKGSLQVDLKARKQSNDETPKRRQSGEIVTSSSATSSRKSSPEQKSNIESNSNNTKESKSISPRDVLSRLKLRLSSTKLSRNSPQRSSAGKVEIQILRPDVESLETRLSEVSLRRSASLKHDPDTRKTWPGMETSSPETCETMNLMHVATDPGQVTKYQRNDSAGPVERQRKRPVLPDENVQYLQALEQSQHAPGSSTDSGLGKDHRHSKSSADSLLEDMPLDISSPVSSQGNSNPPSRPLSADVGDLSWERGQDVTGGRRSKEYRRFLSKSMPQSPAALTPSLGSHEDLLDRPFSTPGSHEDLLASRGEGTRASGSSQGSSIGQAAVQMRAKPPKPRHRPTRRSKTDLGDPKIIKAALTLAKLQGEESIKVERPRSSSGRKRPTSAQGIVGILNSTNGRESPVRHLSHPEGKLSPPVLHLNLPGTAEPLAVDIIEDDYPAEPPKRRSHSLGSAGIDLSQLGLMKRAISLPSGIGCEDEMLSDPDLSNIKARMSETFEQWFAPTLAEALFDHVTMDSGELTFQAGDMIEITDMADTYWWWGCIDKQEGWLPAPFVRLRVSQGETVEECISRLSQDHSSATLQGSKPSHEPLIRKVSLSFLSNDQVSANVIREIITTERDYVKNLADICVGYIEQAHSRPDMFTQPLLQTLFCNIEEIFTFQQQFLFDLETCIDDRMPHLSSIGACFLKHKTEFEIYGEYCNNYPHAINELKDLMKDNKYVQFFEACRLLQSMIKISLDGFLLTPVQKICKYPLQLNELLKYTRPQHPDFRPLGSALDAMRDVAQSINERKRRIEHIENIAVWQKTIGDWEGDDVLERSAMLIYSDEVNRVSLTGRHRTSPRQLFLFDHQLIICRKDILRRDLYLYKDRIDLDDCQIEDLPDGKENEWNVTLRYAWKIQNFEDQPKVYIFMCRSRKEKRRWLRHFAKERKIVHDGLTRGSSFMAAKEAALRTTSSATKPSKPNDRVTVRRALSMPHRKMRETVQEVSLQLPGISQPEVDPDMTTPKRKGRSLFGFQVGKK